MRKIGIIALIIGFAGLAFTLAMDTTVPTGWTGSRVQNIGLMNQKQNLLLLFAVVSIVGAIFTVFGSRPSQSESQALHSIVQPQRSTRKCPFCAENILTEAILCRFCNRDLPGLENGPQELAQRVSDDSTELATPRECVATLVSLGFKVTEPRDGVWEILGQSGVTAFARSPEALRITTARYLAHSKTGNTS